MDNRIPFTGDFEKSDWRKSMRSLLYYQPERLVRTGSSDISRNSMYRRCKENYCLFVHADRFLGDDPL